MLPEAVLKTEQTRLTVNLLYDHTQWTKCCAFVHVKDAWILIVNLPHDRLQESKGFINERLRYKCNGKTNEMAATCVLLFD